MTLLPFRGILPKIDPTAHVFENATVIGDVEIGAESSVWFGVVIRGDVHRVRIGSRTNIQDLSCLHVTHQRHALTIGSGVTVGHMCMLHGCTIENFVLVGMHSTVLDGAVLGERCFLGAGSLVPEGKRIPARVLAFGRPAKVVRDLTPEELAFLETSAANYVKYMGWHFKPS